MALQNLRSSTPSKRPDASSMSDGQIALNTAAASAGLFFKDSNGDLVKTGPVHIGTTAPNSTPATGGSTGNSKGEAWLDTSNSNYVLKIYDGTAWQSVEIAAGSARQLLQTNAAGTDVEFTSNVDVPGTLDVTGATTLDSTASVAGLLSANGKISFAEGNSAAPGIYPGTDTDTGISSPSLNELSFSTAGASRLYIDSSGDVGIGTSNPSGNLHVSRNGAEGLEITPTIGSVYLQTYDRSANSFVETRSIASQFRWDLGGTEAMRIDSSGNVGIGTSSPSAKLHIETGSGNFKVSQFGSSSTDISNTVSSGVIRGIAQGGFRFASDASTEFARISSNGNVGIGSSDPQSKLTVQDNLQSTPTSTWNTGSQFTVGDTAVQLAFGRSDVTPFPFWLQGRASNNATRDILLNPVGGNVGIGTSSPTRDLVVNKSSGNVFISVRSPDTGIAGLLLGDQTADNRGQISYSNSADSMQFLTAASERMRIQSNGRVLIGTTADGGAGGISIRPNVSNGATSIIWDRSNTTATSYALAFENNNSTVGSIRYNNTTTSYITTSDYRVKENVVDITDGITRVKQLAPKRFNFIASPGTIVDGFLAHEAQTVVPEAVTGTHNEVDDDGNAVMQGIDQSKLVPLLTAALQEAIAKIETLEQRLTDAGL